MQITAAVARDKTQPFSIENLELDAVQANEVLVRIAGVGICHTDIKAWQQIRPVPLPIVLGHEGSGVVEAVGSDVSKVSVGDHVVLTFPSCGTCPNCQNDEPTYCEQGIALSFAGQRADGSTPLSKNGETIHGAFFSQSSFATYAIATERNLVKVDKDLPLELLGPLGCGIQTGAGAVFNSLQVKSGTSIAVFGSGSVGLSAIMAASVAQCETIIAVDVQQSRLELAQELGATHTINPLRSHLKIK